MKSVKFLGHIVYGDGITADPDKIAAILEMVAPKNVSDLHRFLGMTNQLGKFSQNLAQLTKPPRELATEQKIYMDVGAMSSRSFFQSEGGANKFQRS